MKETTRRGIMVTSSLIHVSAAGDGWWWEGGFTLSTAGFWTDIERRRERFFLLLGYLLLLYVPSTENRICDIWVCFCSCVNAELRAASCLHRPWPDQNWALQNSLHPAWFSLYFPSIPKSMVQEKGAPAESSDLGGHGPNTVSITTPNPKCRLFLKIDQ